MWAREVGDNRANIVLVSLLQVVTLHSFNCVEYPVIFLALTRLGVVCSTASPLFNEEELADQLKHSEVGIDNLVILVLLN